MNRVRRPGSGSGKILGCRVSVLRGPVGRPGHLINRVATGQQFTVEGDEAFQILRAQFQFLNDSEGFHIAFMGSLEASFLEAEATQI